MNVLLVPGLGNSGPDHWMSHWEKALRAHRAEFDDWDDPVPESWIARLDVEIAAAGRDVILVAHSLGCATIAHWALTHRGPVRAAVLVAPPDVDSDVHVPAVVKRFAPMPTMPLPFPAIVVASTDDPYADIGRAEVFAKNWGADFRSVGPKGHINAASNLGSWPEGRAILNRFVAGLG